MSDWNTGPFLSNWRQYKQQVTDALIQAVAEIISAKKMTTDQALGLLMKHMPRQWFEAPKETGYWGYGNMWLGLQAGSRQGNPGDGEGFVRWKQGSVAGEQSANDDMSHSFWFLYDVNRMQPLLVAKKAAMLDNDATDSHPSDLASGRLTRTELSTEDKNAAKPGVSPLAIATGAVATAAAVGGAGFLAVKLISLLFGR